MPNELDIYDRIIAALKANRDDFFHPEYPDAWLSDRLQRFLPKLPLFVTENCLLRPGFKRDYLHIEQILNFGAPAFREVMSLLALVFRLAREVALPILVESFNDTRYQHLGTVSEQELQFPLLNERATDPWDLIDFASDPYDPHGHLESTLGVLPKDVETFLSPLYGYLYFDQERTDCLAIAEAVSRACRVLHISSASKSLTTEIHHQLASAGRNVGEPCVNYITTIPNRRLLERLCTREGSRQGVRILLEGRFHDL